MFRFITRLRMASCAKLTLLCLFTCLGYCSFSQPANDNCSSAEVIAISNSGYGTGIFASSNVNIGQATIQPGETFAPAVLVAGQNQKSIWFKFTLPTTRKIRVTLQQPGAVIQAGDVGFAVYSTNNCLPAGTSISTKLTPIATFGNTFHPCVDSGVYLVQVSSKAATAGQLSIQIETDYTGATYDRPADAYAFGSLTNPTSKIDFSVECQSMEDGNEVCNTLYNYQQYTKSTWHTFKTPAYFDYLSVLLASPTGNFTGGLQTFGYRLYKGDVKTGGIPSLVAMGSCDSFRTAGYYPDYRLYKCGQLDASTTYTVQLFYKNNFSQDIRLAVAYGGTTPTKAPEPIIPGMAASNQLGTLVASAAGVTTNATDYLACNSRHSLHPCGDAVPASGLLYNANRYNLSTFYTFTLATAANIVINANPAPCGNPPLLIRLYQQSVNSNCATLVNTGLVNSALSSISLECLPAGNYTVQISGQDTAVASTAYYYGSMGSSSQMCLLSNLGQQVAFSIRVNTVQALNRFALQTTGAFDKINNSNALVNGTTYPATADTFGCSPTVLPDTICTTSLPKAMYRQFVIADSGLVGMDNLNYYFQYKLYKGDANALTTAQNKHAYPDRFTGLTPYSICLDYYQYCQADKVCVTAGTYTFTTFGNTNYVNNPDRPNFKFEKITTTHNSPATAQNMGSILDSATAARTSDIDYFSCTDNAVTINGYAPCTIGSAPATKAIYRQFYLKTDAVVSISGAYICNMYGGTKTLFSGKATDGLAGLQPLTGVWRCFGNAASPACAPLPAGWYTVVSYGAGPSYQNPLQNLNAPTSYSNYVGLTDRFTISVTSACPGPRYNRPYKAGIDTNTNQPFLVNWPARFTSTPSVTLYRENFNCTIDTPFVTGRPSCVSPTYNRIAYYVFRVVKATAIQFSLSSPYSPIFAVYSGDVRTADSLQMRTAIPLTACASSATLCTVQPGTYTLIVYGSDNISCSYATPILSKPCNDPLYNRPYKAAIDTITHQPFVVDWGPRVGHTAAYPKTDTTYTLYREYFNCQTDTPFLSHPIPTCNTSMSRVAYYVFKTLRESYVQINTQGLWGAVYAKDVRSDSASFPSTIPVQPCLASDGFIQLCRLPAGTYTLVIFAAGSATNCTSVVPTIYIDQPGYSRFDHAAQAYDFGTVPPDSTWRNGKVGDVNPLNSGRAPSNDFIYCTTGARPADPTGAVCSTIYVPSIYGDTVKYAFTSSTYNGNAARRNLWYTFVTDQGGTVRVRVNNKTIGANKQYQYRFAVYKSNVAGTLPFSTVVSTGQVDSTLAQGLSFIVANPSGYYCNGGSAEVSFYREPCNAVAERYYVIVENTNTYPADYSGMQPNSQAEVSILIDSVNSIAPRFDHYSQAGIIPASGPGTFTGPTDNYSCATRDVPDPIYGSLTTCTKNLWYKFTNTVTGNIQFRVMIGSNNYYDYQNIQLLRQVIPGDSTANGLQYIPYSTTVYDANNNWGQACITPGTYYLLLPGCGRVAEYVYPQIKIVEQAGDFCTAPVVAPVSGTGQATATVTVNCHTIGTDYGEFNPTLTCPANTTTSTYKSSWFRVDITGADTLDITAYLNENTSASSSQIKYRMMTGNCGAMQEQSCVQDALTQNTYKCLTPGSYFFQVFTPLNATGTIDLKLSAVRHADTCAPVNNCLANANFQPQFDCTTGDSVRFVNYSTYGNAIQYSWNFNYNGQTSTAVSPSFFYPALPNAVTYTVTLTSTNTGCGGQGSVTIPVIIPGRPYVNLGKDTMLCNGGSITLNATTHTGSTYLWNTGATTPTLTVSNTNGSINTYWVRVTYNGCIKRDTIRVFINPITGRNQNRTFCGNDSVSLSALRSYGESYLWNTGSTSYLIYASQPGTYYCDVTLNGCTKRDTFNVTGANFSFGPDTTVCLRPTMPYVLNATTAGATGYLWSNNTTAATLNATAPGQYWVRINFGTCFVRDTINITALQPVVRSLATTLCAGQSYTLPNGTVVNTGGVFRDTLRSVRGCDSIITTTTITLKTITQLSITASICQGQTYTLPWGATVANAGVYGDTLRSPADGCDSIIRTVTLIVSTVRFTNISAALCPGQSYTLPSGIVVTTAGIYQDTVRYTNVGCDSLISIITLAIGTPTRISQAVVICAGQNYTLPSGITVSAAGVYADTLRSGFGCDSLITTINLAVRTTRLDTATARICAGQSYTLPSGLVVNATGNYRDTLRYASGNCDSVRTWVNLTVTPVLTRTVAAALCAGQSYTLPSGVVVNTAGIYRDTIRTAAGCDSLITTATVSINAIVRRTATALICSGQSYTLPSGVVVNTTGIYQDTVRYAAGCDSLIATYTITANSVSNRSLGATICAGQSYTLPSGAIISSSGMYSDTLRYVAGCDSVIATVNIQSRPVSNTTLSSAICAGQSYTLPSGIVVNTTGTYRDTLRYAGGGCDSIRYTVNLTIKPVVVNNFSATICAGQSYTLPSGTVVSTSGLYHDTLHYAVGGCDSLITATALAVRPLLRRATAAAICAGQPYTLPSGTVVNAAGTYQDTVRYTAGCDSIINIITLRVNAVTLTSQSATICQGQLYQLPWGGAASAAGTYSDTLRGSTGCDSIITHIVLAVRPRPAIGINPVAASVCKGDSIKLTAYGGTTYNWIQGSGILSPAMAITWIRPQASGPYRVAIYDPVCNLTDTFQSVVTANPLPAITITKSNEVTCMQGSSQLIVRGGSKYSWWPATGLNNTAVSNPLAAPVSTTVYHVKALSDKNCSAEDSIEVKVIKGDVGNGFLVPTAFTPNEDGNNDCFGIRNWGAVTNLQFNVYDRWGLLVFSTTDASKCWDGRYKGQLLDPAAFVYIISANTICGPVQRKGTVILIR